MAQLVGFKLRGDSYLGGGVAALGGGKERPPEGAAGVERCALLHGEEQAPDGGIEGHRGPAHAVCLADPSGVRVSHWERCQCTDAGTRAHDDEATSTPNRIKKK